MGQLANSLTSFRAEYGRLCVLMAQALAYGHNKKEVVEAARGLCLPETTFLLEVRRQRDRANAAYFAASRLDVAKGAIVEIAREQRRVVSSEYMLELPILKGSAI